MGGCLASKDRGDDEQNEYIRNQMIDSQIRKGNKEEDGKVKLLLLGTGDSGKSTFAKQMKVLHKNGFSHTDLVYYQNVLRSNCLQSMQRVIDSMEMNGIEVQSRFKDQFPVVMDANNLNGDIAALVGKLYQDPFINNYIQTNIDSLQIPSSSVYFFENSERFASDNYKPTPEDILRSKLRTTGISEVKFTVNDIEFTMVDVGGQRAERRKWLHCFDGISAVIYLAALDEYNMTLQEDHNINRLDESLRLFEEVSSSQWFGDKSFILFLNKSDLFQEKIKKYPLHKHFDVKKDQVETYEDCLNFISSKYEEVYGGKNKLYIFVTNALDTDNCAKVFEAVRDSVILSSLSYAGFK